MLCVEIAWKAGNWKIWNNSSPYNDINEKQDGKNYTLEVLNFFTDFFFLLGVFFKYLN